MSSQSYSCLCTPVRTRFPSKTPAPNPPHCLITTRETPTGIPLGVWSAISAGGMEKKLLLPMSVAAHKHEHAHAHGGGERMWARPWRWAKTVFFLAAMLASLLLVCAPPLLVVLLDLTLPPALLSASLRAGGGAGYASLASAVLAQVRAFDFRSSLVDLPAVSAARATLILCAYVVCGAGGAYLWVVVASAATSVSYVLAKAAAVLPRGAALQAAAAADARAVTAAGPEAMILLSLALAAAHLAAAYRTSCRERRRMLVYRIDVEGAGKLKGGHQTPKGLKQFSA